MREPPRCSRVAPSIRFLLLTPLAVLALAGCDDSSPSKRTLDPEYPDNGNIQATSPPSPSGYRPGRCDPDHTGVCQPVPVPIVAPSGDDLSAPTLVPEAEKGEKGARNILLEWARALERRDFARADAQWGAGAAEAGSAARSR